MARFDVYAGTGDTLLLDVQANVLSDLNTRLIVPLLRLAEAPRPARRLNPVFTIDGEQYAMLTQFAAAVPVRDLGLFVVSLIAEDTVIIGGLDMLMCGF